MTIRNYIGTLLVLAGLLLIYFEFGKNAIADTGSRHISLYQSNKYSELIEALSGPSENELSARQHYLLLKAYNQTKNHRQSKRQLAYLEKKLPPEFSNLLLYEKLAVYQQSGQRDSILKTIADYRGQVINPFLVKTIGNLLLQEFRTYHNKPLLRESLETLVPFADNLETGPDLLRLYADTFAKNDPRLKTIQVTIWSLANTDRQTAAERQVGVRVLSEADRYLQSIVTHFKSQKRFKNYTYTLNTAPQYLKQIKDKKSDLFNELRRLYLHSATKKRRFSFLTKRLEQPIYRKQLGLSVYQALSIRFDLLVRKGDPKTAIAVLNRMIKIDPKKDFDLKYLSLAKYYFRKHHYQQALYFFERMKPYNPSLYRVSEVQWYVWRTHFLMGNQKELATIAQWAKGHDFNDREMGARFCYWGHKLNLYKKDDLTHCYKQYPLTYYGLHARYSAARPTAEPVGNVSVSQVFAEMEPVTAEQASQLNLLSYLYSLQETKLGDSIVKSMLPWANSRLLLALTNLLLEAERYHMVQVIVESKFRSVLHHNISGRKLLLPYFYPLAYDKKISRLEDKRQVPKILIMAVMREESHFNPEVKSIAGAIGLMQLMPATARYVGKKIGLKVSSGSLTQPDLNLTLGSAYLKQLMKRYNGNVFHTLAAYNGGPTNVRRWIKKTKTKDNDDFVESITFAETQNYVRRVMRTFYIYRNMYEKM